ncbi:GntR family transcriptional regulator [Leucobacter tardus]|uniref:GntR family transcriptional regulator n=1 Tax=Leucobacter tardus TaxID=501483 RepID=A0A939QIL6_9MICO|nr:GntR family transcriptional regulator [Leucobacter tardus]MBO2988581.1 GntR family transcriptional regulator [Leucobacter tardus]
MQEGTILERLRDMVVSGSAPPGELLGEIALAQEFEVSRTPVREALKQLEREGLVEVRPRVGTFVRKPTEREILELFQLKESLEGLAAGLLAQRGEVAELRILRQNVADESAVVEAGDARAYATLVHEFHHTLVTGADNQKLAEHYALLMNQLAYHRIVTQTLALPGRLGASLSEHGRILAAIESKDALAAEFATRNHVAQSRQAATLARIHEHDGGAVPATGDQA